MICCASVMHIWDVYLINISVTTTATTGTHILQLKKRSIANKRSNLTSNHILILQLSAITPLNCSWVQVAYSDRSRASICMRNKHAQRKASSVLRQRRRKHHLDIIGKASVQAIVKLAVTYCTRYLLKVIIGWNLITVTN